MTTPERPAKRKTAVLRARLQVMSVEAFESITWCADCNPTVHTTVVDGFGLVDVKHDSTCPAYRALTEGGTVDGR